VGKENRVGVVIAALFTAIYLLAEGVCILKTGNFFQWGRPTTGGKKVLSAARRAAYAALYLFGGCAVLAILAYAAARTHFTLSRALHLLAPVWLPLLFGLFMVGLSLRAMIDPVGAIRIAKHTHPEMDENDPTTQRVLRLIGVAGFVLSWIFVLTFLS
jgi:hypothetical protein